MSAWTARALAHSLIAMLVASAIGCELAVDTSDLDRGCGANKKWCDEKCVGIDDTAYGCSPTACESPCEIDHAEPKCEAGVCAVKACLDGYGCPGCIANLLVETANCGACGHACPLGNTCRAGVCTP